MVKRSFKMGGTGKVVVVVPESDSDAGTMPAIVESPVTGDAGGEASGSSSWRGAERYRAPTQAEQEAAGAGVMETPVLTAEGWTVIGSGTDEALGDVTVPGAKVDHADIGQGGSVMLDGMGAIIDVLACEPDVINVLQALRADDDGMPVNDAEVVPMLRLAAPIVPSLAELEAEVSPVAAGAIGVDEQGHQWGIVADVAIEVVASEPELSPFAALVAAFVPMLAQPVTEGLDYVVCGSRVELSVARFMAQQMADKLGSVMKVAYVGPGFGQGGDMFFPGQGGKRASGGSGSVRTAKPAASGGATAEAGNVVRLTPGLTVAGDWLTYDARVVCTHPGNASNIKTWQKIRDAAARLDLDTLRAFDFAGARDELSGNTYTRNNGRYLRAMVAKVTADRAALDAEFGFGTENKLAAD